MIDLDLLVRLRNVGSYVNPFFGRDLSDPKAAAIARQWLATRESRDRKLRLAVTMEALKLPPAPKPDPRGECALCGQLAVLGCSPGRDWCELCWNAVNWPMLTMESNAREFPPYRPPWWTPIVRFFARL